MPGSPSKLSQFWQELKRRKVTRTITVYAAAAFVILELTDIVAPSLGLPGWTLNLVIILLCVGFVIMVIVSWIYDINPEGGIVKTEPAYEVEEEKTPKSSQGWKIASYISFAVIIGLIVLNVSRGKQSDRFDKLEKSIAVLPFDNMSTGEEYSHYSDAITDEIILELQKIKEFDRVLSRSSTLQFKNNRPAIPEIAEILGVNYIIEGSIQRHNENVSIRVQVIRAKPENHIWGDEFDDKWENIFSIQDKIAMQVALELKTILSPEEIEQIEKKPTENTLAYNLFLRGRYFWDHRTEEALMKAIEYFNQAVKEDSSYALAYIGLADSYSMLPWYATKSDPEHFIKAEQAALKALEIDYMLAEAHASLGHVYFNAWEFESAEKEFLKAIELNPEYATVHHWYAMLLNSCGRYDKAIEEILIAQTLEPLSLVISRNVGVTYFYARQYDKAIKALNEVIKVKKDFPHITSKLVSAFLYKGMFEEALSLFQEREYKNIGLIGLIYKRMGNLEKANTILDELMLMSDSVSGLDLDIAYLQFSLGNANEGFKYLEKAYKSHDLGLAYIQTRPEMDLYRSDPRFITLLNKMGLKTRGLNPGV